MSKLLLLGPGVSTGRLPHGSQPFGSDPGDQLTVIDRDRKVLDFWREKAARCLHADLRELFGSILLRSLGDEAFDEVHAYEVLNLLTGDASDFFRLWRFIWDTLKPGGKVYASVPHWESQWIHAYPAPQRVYTPGLLGYLYRASSNRVQERFDSLWPEPYDFKIEEAWTVSDVAGNLQGWHFCLVKGGGV